MPVGHDDILERLEVAINAWNMEIAQMRGGLSAEIDKLGEQIDRLPRPQLPANLSAPLQPPAPAEVAEDGVEQLKTRGAELDLLLRAARHKVEELERQARQPSAELAGGTEENLALRFSEALRDRYEAHQEIVSLRAEADLLRRANACLSGPVAPPEGGVAAPAEVFDSEGRRRRLGEILVELGLVDQEQLAAALAEQSTSPQRRLGAILVEKGVTSEDIVARVLARQLGLPFVRLKGHVADQAAPRAISSQLARSRECLPIAVSPTSLVLAMANAFDLVAIEEVELATGRRVDPVVAAAGDIRQALRRYYGKEESQAQP
ncbi:MAG: hypothetical protein NTZ09_20795 [Candidatus Hydrogenedentes bacterium]|nr:hypothetical protein [Candidatus Hydrogenedentota bacterium]